MTQKLIWFSWYPAEAAIDGWWMSLTLAEQGLHFRLLNFAWVNGGLERDLNRVAMSIGLSREEFDKHWPRVSQKWVLVSGLVVNPRQERERLLVNKKSEQAKAAVAIREANRNRSTDTSDDTSSDQSTDPSKAHPRASDCDCDYSSGFNSSSSEKKPIGKLTDELWTKLKCAAVAAGVNASDKEWADIWFYRVKSWDFEKKLLAHDCLVRRKASGQYGDRYTPSAKKFFEDELFTAPDRAMNGPPRKFKNSAEEYLFGGQKGTG